PRRSQVWPVMLAEPLPDQETSRLLLALNDMHVDVPALFVNRFIWAEDAKGCHHCEAVREWQLDTLAKLRKRFQKRGRTLYIVRNRPEEVSGARALRAFTKQVWRLA